MNELDVHVILLFLTFSWYIACSCVLHMHLLPVLAVAASHSSTCACMNHCHCLLMIIVLQTLRMFLRLPYTHCLQHKAAFTLGSIVIQPKGVGEAGADNPIKPRAVQDRARYCCLFSYQCPLELMQRDGSSHAGVSDDCKHPKGDGLMKPVMKGEHDV